MSTAPAQPSTAQLVGALAQSLLPLAGPAGIAVSALVPAIQQLYDTVTSKAGQNFTVDDLAAIVAKGNADLAQLQADVDAQGAKP